MADESPIIELKTSTGRSDRSVGPSTDQRSASSISVEPQLLLERLLTLEIVRVAERAAVSAARLRGQGSEIEADRTAAEAMRRELNTLPIEGIVVIGDSTNEASALLVGERVGNEGGPAVDIAVNPLEGATLCAKGMPDAMATIAIADHGTLLSAPHAYMEKIAIGPGYPQGIVDLDVPPEENIAALAKAKGVKASAITALILDRPRHSNLIAAVRRAGATVRFITDGDVAGVIYTAEPAATGVDVYMGVGGAPQGVLAAAALRCVGGQMQARLVLDTPEKRERALEMGVVDPRRKYMIDEMVRGDCLFAATGVTDGSMLRGVRFREDIIETQTVVMRSTTGTVRRITTRHRSQEKVSVLSWCEYGDGVRLKRPTEPRGLMTPTERFNRRSQSVLVTPIQLCIAAAKQPSVAKESWKRLPQKSGRFTSISNKVGYTSPRTWVTTRTLWLKVDASVGLPRQEVARGLIDE